jgi:hypothetical protein
MKMRNTFPLIVVVTVLLLASLACQQAGEILTPAEATQRAEEEEINEVSGGETAEGAAFENGEKVEFISSGSTIPLYSSAAGRTPFLNLAPGDTAFIRSSKEVEGDIWYQVEGTGGNGWVQADFLVAASGEADEVAFAAGDTAVLQGVSFMINLYDGAGSRLLIAQQERGVQVEVLEIGTVGAETWYKISAPTGDGWVPASNLAPVE